MVAATINMPHRDITSILDIIHVFHETETNKKLEIEMTRKNKKGGRKKEKGETPILTLNLH